MKYRKIYENDLNLDDLINNSDDEFDVVTIAKKPKRTNEYDLFIKSRILNNNNEPLEEWEKSIIETINNIDPKDTPILIKTNDKKRLVYIINKSIKYFGLNGNYNWIDTSEITSLTSVFAKMAEFNGDISNWDVSNVESMNYTFFECPCFKRDLSKWNPKNLKFMTNTFFKSGITATQFKQWDWNAPKLVTKYNKF